ncbi:uncharacterized protein LOC131874092 [Cryptomeria japonica]|uniref:uncharacterized protein LOC131874092 n=1 Tax=Cryptomeria japonica TaxID=3369 RepID=UPI0027DA4C30|nr:uncharacterized protein LOC131874092 [Cryptomeria japonica]
MERSEEEKGNGRAKNSNFLGGRTRLAARQLVAGDSGSPLEGESLDGKEPNAHLDSRDPDHVGRGLNLGSPIEGIESHGKDLEAPLNSGNLDGGPNSSGPIGKWSSLFGIKPKEQAKELPDGIMQLKGNKIPKGLVSLERLFDRHDAYKKNKGDKSPEVQDILGYRKINIDKSLQESLLKTFHDEAYGDHFSSIVTAYKILRNCYYWPWMFRDVYAWVAKCEKCKLFTGKPQIAALPLRPWVVDEPFKQWGLDFIGP